MLNLLKIGFYVVESDKMFFITEINSSFCSFFFEKARWVLKRTNPATTTGIAATVQWPLHQRIGDTSSAYG